LVTDGGGNTTQQSRHFGTGLGESENVVNEEQHILTFFVTEVFGNGETSQSNTGTGSRGFVHLTKDQGTLGVTFELDDTGFHHFVVQIVTFTSTFTDTTEDRVTTVSLSDVVDEFLNQHSLADTSTTEETDLTTTSIRSQQIDNLDTSFEDFGSGRLINEFGSFSMDTTVSLGVDGTTFVNGFTDNVDDTTKDFLTDRNGDGSACVNDLLTTDKT
jgi:peptide chain release factor 1